MNRRLTVIFGVLIVGGALLAAALGASRGKAAGPPLFVQCPPSSCCAVRRNRRMVDGQRAGELRTRGDVPGQEDDLSVSLWLRRDLLRNSEALSCGIGLRRKAQRISHHSVMTHSRFAG